MKQTIHASVLRNGVALMSHAFGEIEVFPNAPADAHPWEAIFTVYERPPIDEADPYDLQFSDGHDGTAYCVNIYQENRTWYLTFEGTGPLTTAMPLIDGVISEFHSAGPKYRVPEGFVGSRILKIGTPVDARLEGGGMVIDYVPAGETRGRRVVFEFTSHDGIWIGHEYQLTE